MRIDPLPRETWRVHAEYVPLATLTLDPENAREHSPAQIRQIARSIEAFGFNAPILVDRDLKVIAGHGRVLALRLLGYTEVPIIRLGHLNKQQQRAYAIADNKLTDASKFNKRQLALHFQILSGLDLDFDLEATGFHMGEIDVCIEELNLVGNAADADDKAEDLPAPGAPVTRLGDLWRLGDHRLYCGSALEPRSYDRLLASREKITACFTDPPWNLQVDGFVSGKGKRRHREFVEARER